ncbi:integrase catalytic domain-containing protein [Trichonephila clavipes]|nr:integrase catalytic domain-containing protein [Trichonephila clavipes]
MVRSIKRILRKCLLIIWVTYEEMLTLLCEGESVLNGRPLTYVVAKSHRVAKQCDVNIHLLTLTYVSDDPNEMTAITPAHFMQGIRGSEVKIFQKPNKDWTKSPEVPGSRPSAVNPVPEVSRPVKQTRCSRLIVPRQRLNL